MPITRTAMTDDDGSGTTGTILNNAWKQEFYDQIDAFGLGLPVIYGPWTPIDASGAGLTLTVANALAAKLGRLVFVTAYVTYPATANGATATLGGLPWATSHMAGFYQTFGAPPLHFHAGPGGTVVQLRNANGTAAYTNANLSAAGIIFSGVYLTT